RLDLEMVAEAVGSVLVELDLDPGVGRNLARMVPGNGADDVQRRLGLERPRAGQGAIGRIEPDAVAEALPQLGVGLDDREVGRGTGLDTEFDRRVHAETTRKLEG